MKDFSFEKIASFLEGTIITFNKNQLISKIVTKFSSLEPGSLLLLRYNIWNEGDFVSRLKEKKASGVILENPGNQLIARCAEAGIGIIKVKDSLKALYKSAELQRLQHEIPFIQVIGSSGKTTTKEMIASVLQGKMPLVKTIKNYNFPSEIAKKILSINDEHKTVVLEAGMLTPEMMKMSSAIIKPDIAVVTTIHRAHFMRFGSIENIISAKAEMLPYLQSQGTLIINGEDENCDKFLKKYYGRNILNFGFSNKCDIWASNISYDKDKTYFRAAGRDFEVDCTLNTFGKYNVANALAAISVGLKLDLDLHDITTGLAKFTPVKNRLEILAGVDGITIVNDNFNANPDSTKLLLENIPCFAKDRPVILVLGDMENPKAENKQYAEKVHFQIGQEAGKIEFLHLIAIGKWAKEYINGALSQGVQSKKLHYFHNLITAREHFKELIIPNSVVVFKSSPYVKVRYLIPGII